MSRLASWLSRKVLRVPLHDPMSGFFMIRRPAFESVMRGLSGTGYKVLLDLLSASERPLRWRELPDEFRSRRAGTSKVSWWVAGLAGVAVGTVWNYVMTALFTWGAGRPGR